MRKKIATEIGEAEIAELRRLEEDVRKGDGDGVRTRWNWGRYLLTLKKGKQLRRGLLNELARKIGVVRSELGARMKFAEKYPTEEKLSTVIETYKSWSAIKQKALTDKPRGEKKVRPSAVRRVLNATLELDPTVYEEGDDKIIAEIVGLLKRQMEATMPFRKKVA